MKNLNELRSARNFHAVIARSPSIARTTKQSQKERLLRPSLRSGLAMTMLSNKLKEKGVSLIAAIAIMLIAAVLTLVMVSMLGTTVGIALSNLHSSQALGLAQAGLNWYMMQLVGIDDWDTASSQTGISLNPGTFDVTVSNKSYPQTDSITPTAMDVAVTGKVTGADGNIIQRTMSQRVWKLPSASKFALFWGRRTGSNLTLTSTAINGNYWSQGTTAIPGTSSVANGSAYRPTTENISGVGSYTEIDAGVFPYFSNFPGATATFSTPAIDTSYYTNLEATYDAKITTCGTTCSNPTSSYWTLNTNFNLTGETREYGTVSIVTANNRNVTISGHGFIVANTINLNASGTNASRVLTLAPSGGDIVIIARATLTVGNGVSVVNAATTDTAGIRMYSASTDGTTGQVLIRGSGVNMNSTGSTNNRMLILAKRRLYVQAGVDIYNSTLFVDDPGDINNNVLYITGGGTIVGSISAPCSLISIARGAPALAITTTAIVRGLLYQRDSGNVGYTNIAGTSSANRVNITGSIIANQFSSNRILNANIIYNPQAIPDPPPEGFNDFVTKKPNSWSGD